MAFEYRTWENSLIPCFTVMSNSPKERFDLKDVLWQLRVSTVMEKMRNRMPAINGCLGLLRVRASMFTQLPIIMCEGWTRTCGWIARRNKKKVLSSMMIIVF